ncbi:MAG: hypothetical protein H0W30_18960 [Gemmatimonadaceae bacterium]|nr:hypothetical protein [Gemmatimonadaceae bacterium]
MNGWAADELETPGRDPRGDGSPGSGGAMRYPGLRVRAVAFALDYLVIAVFLVAVGGVVALLRIAVPGMRRRRR